MCDEHVSRVVDGFIPSDVQFFLRDLDVEVRVWRPDAVLAVALPDDAPDAPTGLVLPVAAALGTHLNRLHLATADGSPIASGRADRVEVLDLDFVTGYMQALADAELLPRQPVRTVPP